MKTNVDVGGPGSEAGGRPLSAFRCSESVAEQPAKIRILVLDEQPLLRWGISAYLNSQPDMMVCGEAGSVSDARSKVAECQPQFVVTALRLGAGDNLKLIKELKTQNRALRILVYSAFEESIFAERAMRAGASGYVMKQAPSEKLAIAIREIVKGGIYVSREVALSAFRKSLLRAGENDHALRSAPSLEELSNREMHIFQLLGSGLGPRQIAQSLSLSVKTIESHRENIKHKLHMRSSRELRVRAAKWVEQRLSAEGPVSHSAGRQPKLPSVAPVTPET
ncbi:MAG: DNA-binding response regulator [Verrucomicrobia bacterium]|nr:MAG: DNA-binding response regulator [Verrucomicrobiota bacterium]